jgi:hypothetical protein
MPAARSAAIVVMACAATAALAACQPNTPVAARSSSALNTAPTAPAAASVATAPSTPVPAVSPITAPSTTATVTSSAPAPAVSLSAPAMSSAPAPAPSCASAPGDDIPDSSITVCPDAGPVGSVVHVTIKHCSPTGNGLPDIPAAALFFLGPKSWLGTNGGSGAYVPYSPQTGPQATATFTIPATYIGGNQHGAYPTLSVTPGTGYAFATDPAGACHAAFTVTAP